MPTYNEYEQEFVQDLINSINNVTIVAELKVENENLTALVDGLINSLPYYGDIDMEKVHRQALANLLESCIPNNSIAPHPDESGPWYANYFSSYKYNGPYSGYKDAFYHGININSVANCLLSMVQTVNPGLNSDWWGKYGVCVLTDAIRQKISISLDNNSLTNALSSNHSAFVPALSASYLAVFQAGFSPTANALQAIQNTGQMLQAADILNNAIADGKFTANINEAISTGGDSSVAATWFLFNLWISLKALGYSDVDAAIRSYMSAGLNVPEEVFPLRWWNGGYLNWYAPLSGADVMNEASGVISTSMPETECTIYPGSYYPAYTNVDTENGYSLSFCNWGSLAWYKPSSGSCFGKGTMVLMGDGTSKPIETIVIGDEVMTNLGIQKVVLVENPKRSNRALYKINDLPLTVTAAHPFRTAFEDSPAYAAIDPWALIDGIPTMTEKGVRKLEENVPLLAYREGRISNELTNKITLVSEKPDNDQELVYDLILGNWEKGMPAYFVGGPQVFLAAEAETIDPFYNPAISIAIITALNIAVPVSREHFSEPNKELQQVLPMIDMNRVEALARKAYRPLFGGKSVVRTSIPKADYYIYNGEWDPHASLLEYYLIRQYARHMKSGLSTGWRSKNYSNTGGERLGVGLFDLELINEPLEANVNISIELELRGGQTVANNILAKVELGNYKKSLWNLRIDKTIDMGRVTSEDSTYFLIGRLNYENKSRGQFRMLISKEDTYLRRADQFIFDNNGAVIGRMCLDMRRMTSSELFNEEYRKKQWNNKCEKYYAISMGRQLGHQLSALMEAYSSK